MVKQRNKNMITGNGACVKLLFLMVTMALMIVPVSSGGEAPEITIVSPSPDGKFAFRNTWLPGDISFELIEKATGKVLLLAAETDEEEGQTRLNTEVVWAPDSRKVALMVSTHRRSADIVILARDPAGAWKALAVPPLPSATIPGKYTGDPRIHHTAVADWSRPIRWRKDGALVVETETTVDGNNNRVTAKRTTVIAFGRDGAPAISSTSQKVSAHFEDPPETK